MVTYQILVMLCQMYHQLQAGLHVAATGYMYVQAPQSVSAILKPVVALYAMKVTETNLAWYMSEGLLSTQVGAAVPQQIR